MENFIWYLLLALLITETQYIFKFLNRVINTGNFGYYLFKFTEKIGITFSLVNVLYHEIGHILTAYMCRGNVYNISLNSDSSGLALTGHRSRLGMFLTGIAGYPFASLVSLSFVYLVINGHYYAIIYILVGTLIGSMLFLVRNLFGFAWCVSFLILTLLVDTYGTQEQILSFVLFVTSILVVKSLTTAIYILYASIYDTENSGDAFELKNQTKLPATFYGILFASQAIFIFYLNITFLF